MDFNDPPKYHCLMTLLQFVQTEMEQTHKDELAKKIQERLDRYKITPYEDEGKLGQGKHFQNQTGL